MQLKGLLNFFSLVMFKFVECFEKGLLGVSGILLLYFVSWTINCLTLNNRSITLIILKCNCILFFFYFFRTVKGEKMRLIPVALWLLSFVKESKSSFCYCWLISMARIRLGKNVILWLSNTNVGGFFFPPDMAVIFGKYQYCNPKFWCTVCK